MPVLGLDSVRGAAEAIRSRFPPPRELALSGAVVDLEQRTATRADGETVRVSPNEARLLRFLAANANRVVSEAELLRKVWGYAERVRSRTAVTTVYRLRRKIEANPSNAQSLVAQGAGYRLVLEGSEPAPAHGGSLPASRDRFVGRQTELEELRERLEQHRLTTLTGPGGTGKTRLALELARRCGEAFPGGAWFVDLAPSRARPDVHHAVAETFGVPLGSAPAVEQLGNVLVERGRLLLVLDNCEQVAADVGELVASWLDRSPELTVLCTSREPLQVRGERRWSVEPLPLPGGEDLAALRRSDAVTLFVTRCEALVPKFRLTVDNAGAIARVVRSVDGLPLALELAAGQLPALSPAQLAQRLEQRLDVLRGREVDRPDRHRTLLASLAWSWDLLDEGERQVLAELAAFEGGWTLEAAEAVVESEDVPDVLRRLVEKSLVRRTSDTRFGLLVSVHAFLREKLSGRDEVATYGRHARFFSSSSVATAEELDNLVVACRRAIHGRDVSLAADLFGRDVARVPANRSHRPRCRARGSDPRVAL